MPKFEVPQFAKDREEARREEQKKKNEEDPFDTARRQAEVQEGLAASAAEASRRAEPFAVAEAELAAEKKASEQEDAEKSAEISAKLIAEGMEDFKSAERELVDEKGLFGQEKGRENYSLADADAEEDPFAQAMEDMDKPEKQEGSV